MNTSSRLANRASQVTLNVSLAGLLTESQSRRLTELEPVVRDEYTEFIGNLAKANHVQGETWLLGALCRNPSVSGVFERLLRLALLQDLVRAGHKKFFVICDSVAIAEVAQSILNQHDVISEIEIRKCAREESLITRLGRTFHLVVAKYCSVRLIRSRRYRPDGPCLFVETAINARQVVSRGLHADRFFPNLSELETEKNKTGMLCFFALVVTELGKASSYLSFWKKMREYNSDIVVKEQYLRAVDYFWALTRSFSIPRRITTVPRWRTFNVSAIVMSEVRSSIGARALLEALLVYRFFAAIKAAGIEIAGVIDWNENQVIDRALCLGVRKFYPGIRIKGYQGFFVPEFYVSHEVTTYEKAAGTTPDEILVISPLLVDQKKRYCPSMKVSTAPAFRFATQPILEKQQIELEHILVGLPIHKIEIEQILSIVSALPRAIQDQTVVRPHPLTTEKELDGILRTVGIITRCIKPSGNLGYQDLYAATLLISGGSSLCIEAIAAGTRVAIIGSQRGVTMNPLRGRISADWWRECYSAREVVDFFFSDLKMPTISRDSLFTPVTVENVSAMLDLD